MDGQPRLSDNQLRRSDNLSSFSPDLSVSLSPPAVLAPQFSSVGERLAEVSEERNASQSECVARRPPGAQGGGQSQSGGGRAGVAGIDENIYFIIIR